MIVPMQKVTLLVIDEERESALTALREIGVMHLNVGTLEDHEDRQAANSQLLAVERVANVLGSVKVKPGQESPLSGEAAFAKASELLARRDEFTRQLEYLTRSVEQLSAWGNFDSKNIKDLAAKGIFVYLCESPKIQFEKISKEYSVELVGTKGANYCYAVCTSVAGLESKLPLASLPDDERSLAEFSKAKDETLKTLKRLDSELKKAALALPAIKEYMKLLSDRNGLLTARDAMKKHGIVATITGFIPEPEMERFRLAAEGNGWAYVARDAQKSDSTVPTLVKMPKLIGVVKPLFNFLGISPGYNEMDASPIILVFFTMFFGILLGDAGYGALFLAATLPGAIKCKGAKRTVFAFISILSISAIVWGVLTNNYFGCSFKGGDFCPALASAADKDSNVQFLCFILGLIQLSLGHFWRMAIDGRWRNVMSQLGWLCMMTANFFLIRTLIVYPDSTQYPAFMMYLYIAGVTLVAAFEVNWLDPGSIMGFPFGLINSFVDLLSYIRLFAVGMAGYYLAFNFNTMAVDLMTGPVGIAAGVVILLIGHSLNIALCVLAVLVHGVRLNTLEFSSHIGLQWSGVPFEPFKKEKNSNN